MQKMSKKTQKNEQSKKKKHFTQKQRHNLLFLCFFFDATKKSQSGLRHKAEQSTFLCDPTPGQSPGIGVVQNRKKKRAKRMKFQTKNKI